MDNLIQILILIALLALSAFFSSAETAMTTANKIRIKTLAEEGNKNAATMLRISEDTGKMLSAILIGNNIVNISASSLAATITIRLFGSAAVGITTGILTLLVLLFGEISPKTMATIHADRMAVFYSPIIQFLMTIMTPVIFIVDRLARLILLLMHIDPDAKDDSITEEELRTLVDAGQEDGVLEETEHNMIMNVFDFGDTQVRDIMVPRADIISVPVSSGYNTVAGVFRRQKFSRLPVYEEDKDNVIGIINLKDFAFIKDRNTFHVRDIMYEPYFTFETKKNSELMVEMREKCIGMTVILDEYGAAAGLITMEDLLEELVGEIRDEYDKDEIELIKKIGEHEYRIEGSVKLDDLNDELEMNLQSEDYDSVGGYIIERLDHLPKIGDKVSTDEGDILTVEKISRRRIAKVHLRRNPLPEQDNENES